LSFFEELKRRNVFRVAIAYLALAWLLIEVAGTLFPAFGIPDWAFRFVVIVLVFGFVPVLVVSWAYEITSEGLKRERDVVRDEPTKQLTARRLDWVTISLVVAALGFVTVDRLLLRSGTMHQPLVSGDAVTQMGEAIEPETTHLPDSIAVLPFANRSANPDDVFFVDGIHDDLLTYIAQIGSIKTISRTSVMQYRETTKPIKQIANELGVMAVLEGGVQRAGEQVRINVQLIDARTDDHLWSEIYDRQLTAANIFSIQSEIAGSIADALRATLTTTARERIESVPTHSLEALEEYFIGRQLLEKRTVEALLKADDHFEKAIALDPDFALAYVALADTYRLQANYAGFPRDEMIIKGQAAVDKALQLKPLLGEAHTSLANLKNMRGDVEGAEASFKRALELNPNYAPAYQWYGEMLGWNFGRPGPQFNRIEDALELSKKAVTLDPMSPIIHNDYAEVLENAGRFEDALAEYKEAVEIDPGGNWVMINW
jgi:TolB-like protein/Tfp pilus assembly protein PilF